MASNGKNNAQNNGNSQPEFARVLMGLRCAPVGESEKPRG